MSFLNLSNNIAGLRKKKGITQEALAEFAGVTKASVSKWETGATTPDIQLLPVLAAFFDVSVDELLGYDAKLSAKQIRFLYHKLAQDFAKKGFTEVWEESRSLVKKYYSCYAFLMQMVVLWLNHASLAETDVQRAKLLEETETLCTRVIEESTDSGLRENASAIRLAVWLQQGKGSLVIEACEAEAMDINRTGDRGDVLSLAYLGAGQPLMAEKSSQIGLYRHLMELINNSMYLLMSTEQDERYCKELLHRTDCILEAYQLDKLNPNAAAGYQYQAAIKLCSFLKAGHDTGDKEIAGQEEIYTRIDRYVQMVERLYEDGMEIHADTFFFRLEDWFEELELGQESVRDGKVILSDAAAALGHPAFMVLQDQKRLEKYRRRLERLAAQ